MQYHLVIYFEISATIPPMTTHHTDEKKPARCGLAEDEFWVQMDGLAARARAGDAIAALALSSRALRMAALCIQAPNDSDRSWSQQLQRCTHMFGHHIRMRDYGDKVVCTSCYQVVGD